MVTPDPSAAAARIAGGVARRTDLPAAQRAWAGRPVSLRFIQHRGHYRQRNVEASVTGVLRPATGEHVEIDTAEGLRRIHYTRVVVLRLAPARPEGPTP